MPIVVYSQSHTPLLLVRRSGGDLLATVLRRYEGFKDVFPNIGMSGPLRNRCKVDKSVSQIDRLEFDP
jgi:hypothetical protein